MPKHKNDNILIRFFTSPLFFICAFVVSFLFLFVFVRNYIEDYNIRREIASLEKEVSELKTKKLESLEVLEYVMSDDFVEEKARTELNLKKPGEQVLVVKNIEKVEETFVGSLEEEEDLNNIWKWWYYFVYHRLPDF